MGLPWAKKVTRLEGQADTDAGDPDAVVVRIQRRVLDVLDAGCHRELLGHRNPIKDLGRVLVVEPGAEAALIRLTPVQADAEQVCAGLILVQEADTERHRRHSHRG